MLPLFTGLRGRIRTLLNSWCIARLSYVFCVIGDCSVKRKFLPEAECKGFASLFRYVQLLMLGFRCLHRLGFREKRISRQIRIARIKHFKFTSWKPTALFSENHKQRWRRLIGQSIFYIIYVDKQVLYYLCGFIYISTSYGLKSFQELYKTI